MKNRLAEFLDTFLTFISVSVLAFVCARYFTRQLSVILLSGFTAGLCVTALIGLLRARKRQPAAQRKKIAAVMNQFIFRTESDCLEYVRAALARKYACRAIDGWILAGKTAVFVRLSADRLTTAQLAEAYAKARGKAERLIVLCASEPDRQVAETAEALPGLKCEIFRPERVYALLKSLGSLPEEEIVLQRSVKAGAKALAREAFSRGKAKHYLFAALMLCFGAAFLPFGVYYTVSAGVLIVLALLCRIDVLRRFGKK